MKYAIIQLGGRQYKISEGESISIESMDRPLDTQVLVFSDGNNVKIGTPFLDDIEVKTELVKDDTADKIRVGRFRAKSRHRRIRGHRQPISIFKINEISVKGSKKPSTKGEEAEKIEKVVVKSTTEAKKNPAPKKEIKKTETVKKVTRRTK